MPAGTMRESRQSVHVPMAGQEQGSRRATSRRGEKGTEGRARINTILTLLETHDGFAQVGRSPFDSTGGSPFTVTRAKRALQNFLPLRGGPRKHQRRARSDEASGSTITIVE
jgi:hypothetical protein